MTAPAAAGRSHATWGRGPTRRARRIAQIVVFLAPGLVLFTVFVIVPIVQAAYYSVFRWNGIEPLERFVGLENYSRTLGDRRFRGAIKHNFVLVGLSLAIQLPLSLGLAFLLDRRFRGRALLRTICFAPYVLSEVITGVAWSLMLSPDGAVDHLLDSVGLGRLSQLWLADTSFVLYSMFIVITWKYIGFGVVLFLAGMAGIPHELPEAAATDGASRWTTLRYVQLPLLGPTIRIWIFLAAVGSLQLFDLIWIMTLGGPAGASETMATYMFDRGFRRTQFGYGSAVAVILFVISFALSLAYQRFVLRRDTRGALTGQVT